MRVIFFSLPFYIRVATHCQHTKYYNAPNGTVLVMQTFKTIDGAFDYLNSRFLFFASCLIVVLVIVEVAKSILHWEKKCCNV